VTFWMKQNDTAPILQVQLVEDDGVTPVSITTAVQVVFNMRTVAGVVLVNRGICTIVNAATGIVEYPWAVGDTAVNSGPVADGLAHDGEFEVVYSTGRRRTFPSDSYIDIVVTDDIA